MVLQDPRGQEFSLTSLAVGTSITRPATCVPKVVRTSVPRPCIPGTEGGGRCQCIVFAQRHANHQAIDGQVRWPVVTALTIDVDSDP